MKVFGIAIASLAIATALATDPTPIPANTAAPENAATPPTSPSPDANAEAPPRTQAPSGQAQPAHNGSGVSDTNKLPMLTLHVNDIQLAPVNPVATPPTPPAPGADPAPPMTTTPTQPPTIGAPSQTQAPNNQAQAANNGFRLSNDTKAPTPTPLANDIQPAPVNPVGGNTFAVPSDSGSQSADAGDEVERKSTLDSESHSGSGSKSKLKPKKSDAAVAATGLVSAAVVVVAMTLAFM